ncbi:MAG: flagellar assembly protein FliH [Helicobacteraceae bacterium]|jgi:flagellar assembly protein FliH|nr:flagellar assembly protein FliH [Helicobacteraceae bacterium]
MEIIISPDRIDAHKIAKYEFKNFESAPTPAKAPVLAPPIAAPQGDNALAAEKETLADISAKQAVENDLVTNLIKKVETFADNVAQLQLRLEKQESEFEQRIETEKRRAFEDGKREGEEAATARLTSDVEQKKAQLIESLIKLDAALKEFGEHGVSLEKELSSIAVEIAREVIAIEVGENSSKIALALASSLLNDIKDALKIVIKVNPADLAALKEAFKEDAKIAIEPDRAVALGGVVIHSDAGNIDAELPHRFAAIRKSVLGGGE